MKFDTSFTSMTSVKRDLWWNIGKILITMFRDVKIIVSACYLL